MGHSAHCIESMSGSEGQRGEERQEVTAVKEAASDGDPSGEGGRGAEQW